MSAWSRSLAPVRTAGSAARPFASSSVSVHGRTAAYRRLSTLIAESQQSCRLRKPLLSSSEPLLSRPLILRSPLRSDDLFARTSTIQTRNVSFREMQKAAREKRETEGQKKPKAEVKGKAKPQPQAKAEPKPAEKSAADEAWEKIQADIEKEKAKRANEEKPEEEAEGEAGEKKEGEKEKKKEEAAPPPPHGDKTPWQVFTETLSSEFKASKEWNESTKQLAAGVQDFTQNPNVKAAQSAYRKTADAATSTAGSALKTGAKAIGQGAAWTWDTTAMKYVRKGVSATGQGLEKVTRPVRETEAYKNVKEVIDDGSSSRYGGWTEKEERRKRRELREQKEGGRRPVQKMEEDPNAGTNVTLHKDAAWKEQWRDFRDQSRVMQSLFAMKSTYKESENPLISTARSISDRVAGFFAENETAMVIKKFREMDPNFQLEPFLTEMREYILPEVLDAYVKGDTETLKLWLSAAQYQVYAALMKQYTTAGLKSDGKILDIRGVDILSARMLDPGEIPVFIITCRTQEVHVYRNKKSGELAAGMDDKVQQVTYAIGVTRIPEDVNNPETRGWRLIELQKSARDYI